jgi:hypothetical protein
MVLSHADKVNLVKSLAPHHKAKLRKNLKEHIQSGKGMSGAGFLSFLSGIGKGLLGVVKTVGMPILQDVLLPAATGALQKKLGGGLKIPGGALRLAGQRGKRGRGRPMY